MLTIQELNEELFGRRLTSGEDLALAPKKPMFNRGDFVRVNRTDRMITQGLDGAVL